MHDRNRDQPSASGAGRVVVVTGASAGIGRATAVAFAERGARVALLARGADGLAAAADAVREAGGVALPIEVDMAKPEDVEGAAGRVTDEFGPIDVWVNDAFTSVFAPFCETSAAEYRRVTDVSYLGFVYGTQAALRRMRVRNSGVIVQVGSALAYRGIPLQSAYCGAKHAIQGFTESVRCELLHDRSAVRITMVQLPAVNTPQFSWVRSRLPRQAQPVPPIYPPGVAAAAIVHAADHPRRREYWVGTSTALTIVANAVAPGVLDRYLARTGFDSQQTSEPAGRRSGNLWRPWDSASGHDFGPDGEFSARTVSHDPQPWMSRHHGLAFGTTAAIAGVAKTLAVHRTRQRHRNSDR